MIAQANALTGRLANGPRAGWPECGTLLPACQSARCQSASPAGGPYAALTPFAVVDADVGPVALERPGAYALDLPQVVRALEGAVLLAVGDDRLRLAQADPL